jgi:Sulfotransferase family
MQASRDWRGTEAAISQLLPGAGGASTRLRLLASLAEYSSAVILEARALGAIVPSTAECAQALEWMSCPVFICGHQRSGTTLLQNLLDGHPQLLVLPSEGTYFTSFAYVARTAPTDRDLDRFAAEWIARLVDPNFAPHFRLGMSDGKRNPGVDFARSLFGWCEALRGIATPKFAPLLALVAAFRATSAPASTPALWVEKTPQNERFAARLEALPGARFIHVVRDPRAILASLAEISRKSGVGRFDAAQHARAIGRSLQLAITNRQRFRGRYIVVRYEDLIDEPEREIELVRRFLGITRDAALLVPTASGVAVRGNSSFAVPAPSTIDRQPPRVLPTEHTALLGVYAASAARTLGYEIKAAQPIERLANRLRHWPHHALRSSRAPLGALMRKLASKRGGGRSR